MSNYGRLGKWTAVQHTSHCSARAYLSMTSDRALYYPYLYDFYGLHIKAAIFHLYFSLRRCLFAPSKCLSVEREKPYRATRNESEWCTKRSGSFCASAARSKSKNSHVAAGSAVCSPGLCGSSDGGNAYCRPRSLMATTSHSVDGLSTSIGRLYGAPHNHPYVWLDYVAPDGTEIRNPGWKYWLPNPLFPFIWFRVAIPREHADIRVEENECAS